MTEVTVEQGKLRGTVAKDINGNKFYKFQGIPYAKPPLGDLRFKAPQPAEKWSGVYDATKERDVCYAKDPLKNKEIVGSENCLFLNVYTKKLPGLVNKELRPVLFWIHGGGFVWGSGNEDCYGPDFLVTENVVLVTINYRLGLLGFASFEDPSLEIPGNAALKDQVLALKWVQNNIKKFGGDPGNVTIFGQSAGGMSVHLLVLSPMGKGLFHKAIAQSGTVCNLTTWGTFDPKLLASAMDLEGADDKTVYDALMTKSSEEVLNIQEKGDALGLGKKRMVGVTVEKNSKEPFLDREPMEIIRSGQFNQVPFMAGYTTCEAMFFTPPPQPGVLIPINFENFVPRSFGLEPGSPESLAVADQIEKFYFGDEGYTLDTAPKLYDLTSDYYMAFAIHEAVLSHYDQSERPVYFYRVSAETELNFYKKFHNSDLPGVSHMDDIGYLFKNFLTPEIKPGSMEGLCMSKFIRLWTNFAKSGNPTPDKNDLLLNTVWKPVAGADLDFLDIGFQLVPMTKPDGDRMNFWDELYAGHNGPNFDLDPTD